MEVKPEAQATLQEVPAARVVPEQPLPPLAATTLGPNDGRMQEGAAAAGRGKGSSSLYSKHQV